MYCYNEDVDRSSDVCSLPGNNQLPLSNQRNNGCPGSAHGKPPPPLPTPLKRTPPACLPNPPPLLEKKIIRSPAQRSNKDLGGNEYFNFTTTSLKDQATIDYTKLRVSDTSYLTFEPKQLLLFEDQSTGQRDPSDQMLTGRAFSELQQTMSGKNFTESGGRSSTGKEIGKCRAEFQK